MPKRKGASEPSLDRAIIVRVLAMRDVVSRLLAYAALQSTDLNGFLQEFSEATEDRIHAADKATREGEPPDAPDDGLLEMQEEMRQEVDWYVATARKIAGVG